tara:strand:- start:485 stop:811 length:327 start_codon:yes stop_codon:yes gene_type:complete
MLNANIPSYVLDAVNLKHRDEHLQIIYRDGFSRMISDLSKNWSPRKRIAFQLFEKSHKPCENSPYYSQNEIDRRVEIIGQSVIKQCSSNEKIKALSWGDLNFFIAQLK